MENIITYQEGMGVDPKEILENCQGRIILSDSPTLTRAFYEAGAKHVFCGNTAKSELKAFLESQNLDRFFDTFHTSSLEFYHSLKEALINHSEEVPLLLLGESGVGKTHLARKIHQFFAPEKPYISKNLCELSPQLIESELFGHVKGSFTGAHQDKEGLLSQINGGTLFLDEIGALPIEIQKKLLKVMEEGVYTPVGSTRERRVSFRLISATCDDLVELKKNGKFREDFYFRIAAEVLHIPPLRRRKNDIRFLLKEFQKGFSRQLYITPEALNQLVDYEWRGNVRELYYAYCKLQRGKDSIIREFRGPNKNLKPTHLDEISMELDDSGLPGLLTKLESHYFSEAMERHSHRPNRVCSELKISKSVFYRLQERLNQDREGSRPHLAN